MNIRHKAIVIFFSCILGAVNTANAQGRSIALFVPNPIQKERLLWYIQPLQLNTQQYILLDQLLTRFNVKEKRIREGRIQRLRDESEVVAEIFENDGATTDLADSIEALFEKRKNIVEAMTRMENKFFAELLWTFAHDNNELLQYVKYRRARDRYSAAFVLIHYPGCRIDLAELVYNITSSGKYAALSPELNSLLLEYEQALTPAWRRVKNYSLRAMTEGTRARAQAVQQGRGPDGRVNDPDLVKQARTRRTQLKRRSLQAAQHVMNLNKLYLRAVGESLPSELVTVVKSRFNQRAYSPVYPNPYSINNIHFSAVELKSLTEQQRHEMDTITAAYQSQEHAINKRMIQLYVDWSEMVHVRDTQLYIKYPKYKRTMDAAQQRRKMLASNAMLNVKATLDTSQIRQLETEINLYKKRINSHAPSERGFYHYIP